MTLARLTSFRTAVVSAQIIALGLFVAQPAVHAGNTWDGGGGDNNWGTGNNWSPDGSPGVGTGSDLFFGGTTRLTSNNNYTAFDDFRNLTFNSGAGAFTVTGNSIDFFGKIENLSSNTQTLSIASFSMNSGTSSELNPVNGNLTITSASIFNNGNEVKVWGDNGKTLTITGQIQGTGAFSINQNSTAVFQGAQLYTGQTKINAGTLRVETAPSGTGLTSAYFVGNGGATGTAAALTLGTASTGTLLGNAVTVNQGSGGNRVIASNNTTGTSTMSGAVTVADSNATFRAATGGTLAFGTVSASSVQTVSIGGSSNDGTVSFGGLSDNVNIAATVNSGTFLLAKSSSSTVHAVGGALTVNSGGTARLGGSGGDQIFNSSGVTVNSGGTFDTADKNETIATLSIAGTGVGGNGALRTSTGSSSLTPSSTTLASAASIGVDNAASTLTLNGAVTGSGALTKVGSGKLVLNSTSSTYSGATTISAGTIEVTANNALGSTAGGTTVAAGAALLLNNAAYAAAEGLNINGTGISGGGALVNSGTSSYAGQITAATSATINAGGGTLTLSGGLVKDGTALTLSGGGTINVNSVGISGASANSDLIVSGTTVNVNAASSYNGPTFIRNGGTLNANTSGALPTSPRSVISLDDSGSGSSTLGLGAAQVAASLASASTSTVALGSNTLTVGSTTGSTIFNGTITGSGSLTKDGASTQTLSQGSTYSGGTTVSAGTLNVTNTTGSATGSGALSVAGGATLAGNGKVDAGANTITINGALVVGDASAGSPSASVLELKTTGSTVLGASSDLFFDLFANVGDNTANASAADKLRLFGSVTLDSDAQLYITDTTGSMTFAAGNKWAIADISGATVTGNFSTANIVAPALGSGLAWGVTNTGSIWQLTIMAIPEPSRALLLGLGLMGLVLRRRR